MRDMLFVSHANPEDDEPARWLTLQLAREGYPVWCDLTKLLGGEDFWRDAEQAIRERTAKFLFVLTRTSNTKPGTLDELQTAKNVARDANLHDFIIPLRFDGLPPRDANIRLARLNSIGFQPSWATGLASLLKKLHEDGVVKDARFTPAAVAQWWRRTYRKEQLLHRRPERLIANWFPIRQPPPLKFHELNASDDGEVALRGPFPFPALQHGQHLVSFADATDFARELPLGVTISKSDELSLAPDNEPKRRQWWSFAQEHNALLDLLDQAWQKHLQDRGLPRYFFASGGASMYFNSGLAKDDRVLPPRQHGRQTYRQVVGFSTVRKATAETVAKLRYWHFGIEARPMLHPELGYAIRTHVLFSDDGQAIWPNKNLLHRARRSQCKQWWNDEWRDRLLGSILWLADGQEHLSLVVGSGETLDLRTRPLEYTSDVSYDDTEFEGPPLDEDDEEDVEQEAEDTIGST